LYKSPLINDYLAPLNRRWLCCIDYHHALNPPIFNEERGPCFGRDRKRAIKNKNIYDELIPTVRVYTDKMIKKEQ
jgi:hypothetical protein